MAEIRTIALTQGKTAVVDAKDYAKIVAVGKWQAKRVQNSDLWYATHSFPRIGGKRSEIKMHQFVAGGVPLGKEIDHADRDGLNNTRQNLRICTHSENCKNRKKRIDNTSGYFGVSWHKCSQSWQAWVVIDKKVKYIGLFRTPEAAAWARDELASVYYGEFAKLNFPEARWLNL